MLPIQKLGQHAFSAVSLMLTYLTVTAGIEGHPNSVCTGHSNEYTDRVCSAKCHA